ncbi:MAG: YdcF family protein [Gammaproteobacteria bacterium]
MASLLGLFLLSLPVVINVWARLWESVPPLQAEQVKRLKPQALVVIGGGGEKGAPEYPDGLTVNVRTLLRMRYAAELAREFSLPVLASGGYFSDSDDVSESQLMAQSMENDFNVKVAWREGQSRNTAENARFSGEILLKNGVKSILLVTQAYHMPRALSEFTKTGLNVLPAPTAFIGHNTELTIIDFLPSATALMNSYLLAHEAVGCLWYAIRY